MQHIADNHEALLDYLYEEGDAAERLRVARHLQECALCSVAVLEFQSVRGMLRDWRPPAADLGFRLVQDGGAAAAADVVERSDRRRWAGWFGAMQLSRWPQAAAAVLLFAAGMAVSQLHVETTDGAFVVRTRPASAPAEVPVFRGRTTSIALPAERLDAAASDAKASAPAIDVEQVLQRVRAMIDQSEQRQQRELALRLSQVANEVDAQHQADLLRIQQNLGQQQDDFMNYLVRTGGGPK